MSEGSSGGEHNKRDAESLWALGIFLVVLSVPVFIGTFFEEGNFERLVNVAAGAAVFVIGALMIWRGIRVRKHLR